RGWADYGARHPALRRVLVFALVLTTIFVLLGGIGFSGALPAKYDPTPYAKSKIDEVMGKTGA
ncbi:hypothetical protein LTR53_020217, partial [Teratosphaeriaceae sp. CCFEE 6253]